MTQQEKEEIRQIIREELNASKPDSMRGICHHYWVMDNSGTITIWRCTKCGSMTSGDRVPFGVINTMGPGQ